LSFEANINEYFAQEYLYLIIIARLQLFD